MVPKLFKKYYCEKCNHSTFPMPKTITQIRPDDLIKSQGKAKRQKGSNFGTYTYTYLVF